MELAKIMPDLENNQENDGIQIDMNLNWLSLKNDLRRMKQILWINFDNPEQRFAFNIINKFNEKNPLLLMIIIDIAGTGKTLTVNSN